MVVAIALFRARACRRCGCDGPTDLIEPGSCCWSEAPSHHSRASHLVKVAQRIWALSFNKNGSLFESFIAGGIAV